jgi:hypothetical protein
MNARSVNRRSREYRSAKLMKSEIFLYGRNVSAILRINGTLEDGFGSFQIVLVGNRKLKPLRQLQ